MTDKVFIVLCCVMGAVILFVVGVAVSMLMDERDRK